MKTKKFTRRQVIAATSAGVLETIINWPLVSCASRSVAGRLAINGGEKVHNGTWPTWPVWDQSAEPGIIEMLRTGRWWRGRGEHVAEFEQKYGELMGAKVSCYSQRYNRPSDLRLMLLVWMEVMKY